MPRVFAPHPLAELSERSSFVCRYVSPETKETVLARFDGLDFEGDWRFADFVGVIDLEACLSFEVRAVFRAIIKIGLNLLAAYCSRTHVTRTTFPEAMSLVLDDIGPGPSMRDCGFVAARDTRTLECPPGAHKFRLTHYENWGLDCAFFGGRIGATVAFPGQCNEDWLRADIVAPLGSDDWTAKFSRIVLPRYMSVSNDIREIAASLRVGQSRATLRFEKKSTA